MENKWIYPVMAITFVMLAGCGNRPARKTAQEEVAVECVQEKVLALSLAGVTPEE